MYNQYPQYYPMDAIRRNRMSVKSFFGSSNVLTLGILYVLSIILTFVAPIFTGPMLNNLIDFLYARTYGPNSYIYSSTSYSISIPVMPILLAIAFFLMYSAGKNKNPDTPNSAGATILKVVSIIQLVVICMAMFAVVAVIVLAFAFGSVLTNSLRYEGYYGGYSYGFISGSKDVATLAIILLIVTLLICIFVITLVMIYAIGMVRFSSSLKKGLTTPELTAKGSKAVGVCSVFFAIYNVLIALAYAFFGYLYLTSVSRFTVSSESILGIIFLLIPCVLSFVLNISMAKFAFSFNKHVQAESLKTPAYVNTNFAAPVYPAAAPVNNVAQPAPVAVPVKSAPVATPVKAAPAPAPEKPVIPQPVANPIESLYYSNTQHSSSEHNNDATTTLSDVEITVEEDEGMTTFLDEGEVTVNPGLICPICGASLIPNQAFCSECGYKLI